MRALTKRERSISVICILLVVSYIGFNGIYKPLSERLEFLDQKAVVLQEQLKKNEGIIQSAKAVEKDYTETIGRFKQTKSNEQEMSAILSEIEQVARQLGLQIADLKPQRVKTDANFNRFSVSLTISSELDNIIQFLYELQREPHFFNVEEVRFDKGAQRGVEALKTSLILSRFLIP